MKNQILFLLTVLGIMLNFTACTSEDILNSAAADSSLIHFVVDLPTGELRTRAYGDGSIVSNLKCYVYADGADLPMHTENIVITSTDGKRGGSFGIDLPSNKAYDFVFLATSCPQDDKESKVYYNPLDRTINLNYSKIEGNDEDVDCFFGVLQSITPDWGLSHKVTLKRPYAQLNIGTKDLEEYNKMASAELQTVGVSVDGVYTSMNVMDGECIGNPSKVTLAPTAMPTGQTFPVKDVSYLAMDYLLVKNRRDVSVSLTGSNGSSSFTSLYENIPLQRNYQTVVYGNLLTAEKDFTVEINPEFASSGNKDVDDPWADYDLVLSTSVNRYSDSRYLTITTIDNENIERDISLTPYIDSNGYVKVTWEQLNISNILKLYFKYTSSTYYCKINSLIKCNINSLGITDLSYFFLNCKDLTDVRAIIKWDTKGVTDMKGMYEGCSSLTSLDLSSFDTQNVTDMSSMFGNCIQLASLNLSSFDTQNVTNMSSMFDNCSKLSSLDLSSFDTQNVTDMSSMFGNCIQLASLNLSSFDTQNVTNMSSMFFKCSNLNSLNLSSFDTRNVTKMNSMFHNCSKLSSLDLSSFDTRNVTNMSNMFSYCSKLSYVNLSSFDTQNVTNMSSMFEACTQLSSLDLSSFDTQNVTNMSSMFDWCTELSYVNLSSFDTRNVTNMSKMFYYCYSLTSLDLSSFDNQNVTNMSSMFYNCSKLSSLDLSSFDTQNVTNMSSMFYNCSKLSSLDLSSFDTRNVTNMSSMFEACTQLSSLNLSSFDTRNVTNMSKMFYRCKKLSYLDLSSFDTQNVTNMSNMFYECNAETTWGPNGGIH